MKNLLLKLNKQRINDNNTTMLASTMVNFNQIPNNTKKFYLESLIFLKTMFFSFI